VKKFLFLFLITLINCSILSSKILQQPYLCGADSRTMSIYVLVESSNNDPITIGYEESGKVLFDTTSFTLNTLASPKTFVHRIYLNKLEPNKTYKYWVQNSDGTRSYQSEFQSPVSDNSSFIFGIMGDCRTGKKIHNEIAKNLDSHNPRFLLYTGDLCYDGSYKGWKDEFFVPNELTLLSKSPYVNAIGNHEKWGVNTQAFQQSPNEKENKSYFDFDYGDIHFIIMDTEQNFKKGSEQYNFIKKSLETTSKKFKIICSHIPGYTGGGAGHGENENMINISKELFVPNKVEFVLSGHIHTYQHNFVEGVHHLVIGGGGAPLYHSSDKEYTLKTVNKYNYVIAEYKNNFLKLNVYDDKNNLIDSIEVKK